MDSLLKNRFLCSPLLLLLTAILIQAMEKDKGIDTCEVMPKMYISFSGRKVISEGECFWDYMSCVKRRKDKDKGCCKSRFESCCHVFRPVYNEQKPIPDVDMNDSVLSDSNRLEESVPPPATTEAPTTIFITSTTTEAQQTSTNAEMEETTVKEESSSQVTQSSTEEQTTHTSEGSTKKESWLSSFSLTKAPPRIIDCVWQFNRCIQRKFERSEREDICYAIFEDCKMFSMGMSRPVTTNELPQPIPTKPSVASVSTESTTTKTTDLSTELATIANTESSTLSNLDAISLLTTVSEQGSSELYNGDSTTTENINTLDSTSSVPILGIGSESLEATQPEIIPPEPQNLPIVSTVPITTTSNIDTTTRIPTNSSLPITTTTTDVDVTTKIPSNSATSTAIVTETSTILNDKIVDNPTTSIIENLQTTTEKTTSNLFTTVEDTTISESNTDNENLSTTQGFHEETSTVYQESGEFFTSDSPEESTFGLLDIIQSGPELGNTITLPGTENNILLNEIPFNALKEVKPQVYTNTFQCIWGFNGCVKRGIPEQECRKSFRECDDKAL